MAKESVKTPFFFGAAAAAHQCEGNNTSSDWWEFEKRVMKTSSGAAADHYHRFEEDFQLAEDLGHNAHRFSIEWAKVEPEEGKIDHSVLEHYTKVFASLRRHHLKPFVTYWHFTLPLWFAKKGGFRKRENFHHFVSYCRLLTKIFKNDLEYVMTMNEPVIYATHAYLMGKWPPQKKNFFTMKKVVRRLAEVHNLAYDAIKKVAPELPVGVAKNNILFTPDRRSHFLDRYLARSLSNDWNLTFLDLMKQKMDFIGLNHYFHRSVRADIRWLGDFFQRPLPTPRKTDLNWEVDPTSIGPVLRELWDRYGKPIIITENGVADEHDSLRQDYIPEVLKEVFWTREHGVNIFGYLHWALTDNFEWAEGYGPRFGLIGINYETFERTVRPSAQIYKKLIRSYLEGIEKHTLTFPD